jgi:hypothetical protein
MSNSTESKHTPGPYTVTLNCKGLLAYRNQFHDAAEAIETADRFACHKGTRIEVTSWDGTVIHARAAIAKATGSQQ